MSDSHMLQGKRAVVLGAGGSIGAAVASDLRLKARRSFWLGEPGRTWMPSLSVSERRVSTHTQP